MHLQSLKICRGSNPTLNLTLYLIAMRQKIGATESTCISSQLRIRFLSLVRPYRIHEAGRHTVVSRSLSTASRPPGPLGTCPAERLSIVTICVPRPRRQLARRRSLLTPSGLAQLHGNLIVALAAQQRRKRCFAPTLQRAS